MTRYTKTEYPVGATWEITEGRFYHGTITLQQRTETFEIWIASYTGHYGHRSDWFPSYRTARDFIPLNGRMKRTK